MISLRRATFSPLVVAFGVLLLAPAIDAGSASAVGHSVTLLAGALAGVSVSSYLVDAIIGLSVVYEALDSMGVYQRWFGCQPDALAHAGFRPVPWLGTGGVCALPKLQSST
jgi:hypothetical protein